MSENQRPAAGWYVDPGVPDRLRYWDGDVWTQHYQPNLPPESPRGPDRPPGAPAGVNAMAIAAMILGIVWVFWIGSILALVFGYIGLGQIKRTGESGRGMAIAGVVLGWVGVGTLVLFLVLALIPGPTETQHTCFGNDCGVLRVAPIRVTP